MEEDREQIFDGIFADPIDSTGSVSADGFARADFLAVAAFAAQMFAGAVLIALPAVTVLLVVQLAMGVMTRAAPQMDARQRASRIGEPRRVAHQGIDVVARGAAGIGEVVALLAQHAFRRRAEAGLQQGRAPRVDALELLPEVDFRVD